MNSQLLTLVLHGKILEPATPEDVQKLDAYIATLQPGQRVEMFVSDIPDITRTKAQLAYFHLVVRHISQESGQPEADLKLYVKREIGFIEINEHLAEDGSAFQVRSLSSASKEELSLAINVAVAIADTLGIRLPEQPAGLTS